MKKFCIILFVLYCSIALAQQSTAVENIIIITTDGFRWQEVYGGMDSAIANNPSFNQKDSAGIYKKYWADSPQERRKKLLPFLWSTMATNGQLYGNRAYGNDVDNANPYWFSYPGYNEIFCGFVDTSINTNAYPDNPHTNVLEFLNKQDGFKGKVAAFCAWEAFHRILNEKRSGIPVIAGEDLCGGTNPTAAEQLINDMKRDSFNPFGSEVNLDVYTQYAAMDYLTTHKPRVLYISYGETDEWAHLARYKDYLDAAHHVDKWLQDIWNFVQSDPKYKNKTALFITVDHGRGDVNKEKWTSHNNKIPDAHQIWFGVMAPGLPAKGEVKEAMQLYQKQFARTFSTLLGFHFTCEHPVANGLNDVLK